MNISRLISLIVIFFRRNGRGQVRWRLAACVSLAVAIASLQPAGATVVRMETTLGTFNIQLYDTEAHQTVTNFLNYVNRENYSNTVIHRSVPGSIIQGGGYTYNFNFLLGQPDYLNIRDRYQLTDPSVPNEFSPLRPNVRGTIAMAKLPLTDDSGNPIPGGGPDSATSQWFINVADNPILDDPNNNGGYTVFGRVLDSGMDVVDQIAGLRPICNKSDTFPFFTELPTNNYDRSCFPGMRIWPDNLALVYRLCVNDDGDGVCSVTEDLAPNRDGNDDETDDSQQANVVTIPGTLGGTATFEGGAGMKFESAGTITKNAALDWLKTFTSPPNQSVHFNNGMFTFSMTGTMVTAEHVVTLRDGADTRPTRYYAYTPTLDNRTPHWYDFSYDGETGAEISGDLIILHFVDGKRGDGDLDPNSITHTGGQVVVTTLDNGSAQGGGCSITTTPSQTSRGGDWMVVSLFLAFVAAVRRRTRRQVQRGGEINIASP